MPWGILCPSPSHHFFPCLILLRYQVTGIQWWHSKLVQLWHRFPWEVNSFYDNFWQGFFNDDDNNNNIVAQVWSLDPLRKSKRVRKYGHSIGNLWPHTFVGSQATGVPCTEAVTLMLRDPERSSPLARLSMKNISSSVGGRSECSMSIMGIRQCFYVPTHIGLT